MSWAIGYDDHWQRDIGYGVPATCDHPKCRKRIDRGLAYVCCGEEPYGGEHGCGWNDEVKSETCSRCMNGQKPFKPKRDVKEWICHKATHPSWAAWRKEQRKK